MGVELGGPARLPVVDDRHLGLLDHAAGQLAEPAQYRAELEHLLPAPAITPGVRQQGGVELLGASR
jgi:hypothetical protein